MAALSQRGALTCHGSDTKHSEAMTEQFGPTINAMNAQFKQLIKSFCFLKVFKESMEVLFWSFIWEDGCFLNSLQISLILWWKS